MSHLYNDQHISQEKLLLYVEDDCSRTEMREIDRHLATCPMCSDAVEGLMLLSTPTVVVDNLNKKIDKKIELLTAERPFETPAEIPVLSPILTVVKRPFWQQRWAAAAAVLLLVSGSFWIYKNSQLAKNQPVASTKTVILPNSDTVKNTNVPPQYAAVETAKKDPKTNLPTVVKDEDKIASTTATPSGIASRGTEAASANFKDNSDKNQTDDVGEKVVQNTPKPSNDIAIENNVSAKPAANAPVPTYGSTPVYDRTRDYAGASAQSTEQQPKTAVPTKPKSASIKKLEEKEDNVKHSESRNKAEEVVVTSVAKAKKQESNTPSVSSTSDQILSRADGYFKQKYYETAAADYVQFINLESSGDRQERALFQIATCYAKLNRKAEAKVIFEKLIGMNGQYERPAKKSLKDL